MTRTEHPNRHDNSIELKIVMPGRNNVAWEELQR